MAPSTRPSLRLERALLRDGARVVVGMDEVGRGALAGPVSVGAVAVDLATRSGPRGVADSKLLTAAARTALLPALGRWGLARAVGHASPGEIDALGIVGALRLAGARALAAICAGLGEIDVVVLDGTHDWLSPPADLFALGGLDGSSAEVSAVLGGDGSPHVLTRARADRTCASVAAASVLAKCERDEHMTVLHTEHPDYGWADNKGYGAPEHLAALERLGPSPHHRVSWRLPGQQGGPGQAPGRGEPASALVPDTGHGEPAPAAPAPASVQAHGEFQAHGEPTSRLRATSSVQAHGADGG